MRTIVVPVSLPAERYSTQPILPIEIQVFDDGSASADYTDDRSVSYESLYDLCAAHELDVDALDPR